LNRDPIGERGGINLYGFVGNDGVNYFDFLGLEVTRDAVISYSQLLDNVKKWERRHQWGRKGSTARQRLKDFRDTIHDSQIFTSIGSFSGEPNYNKVITNKLGWHYVYTDKKGWIDFGHFSNAAQFTSDLEGVFVWDYGTRVVVRVGGMAVELGQFLSNHVPGFTTSTKTSAFTREDFNSNSLGAIFASYVLRQEEEGIFCSIHKSIQEFLEPYGPSDTPVQEEAYKKLQYNTQKELDNRMFHNYLTSAWVNLLKEYHHGIFSIYVE
jgi:hypothetical protein